MATQTRLGQRSQASTQSSISRPTDGAGTTARGPARGRWQVRQLRQQGAYGQVMPQAHREQGQATLLQVWVGWPLLLAVSATRHGSQGSHRDGGSRLLQLPGMRPGRLPSAQESRTTGTTSCHVGRFHAEGCFPAAGGARERGRGPCGIRVVAEHALALNSLTESSVLTLDTLINDDQELPEYNVHSEGRS